MNSDHVVQNTEQKVPNFRDLLVDIWGPSNRRSGLASSLFRIRQP